MGTTRRTGTAFAIAGIVLSTAPSVGFAVGVVFSASGSNPAAIQASVDSFRTAVGAPNNGNAAGPIAGGRREINWDGGGATTAAPVGTPFAGFQTTRGALFTTPGTGFLQTPVNDPALTAINPTYASIFQAFSPVRIFTPVGSNITDATFSLPGSPGTLASVSAFGAVFSDVDLANITSLQFFDLSNVSLGTFFAPAGATTPDGSLSFVGVVFNAGEQIGRIRITTGNLALGPNDGGGADVVVMDDFIYSEPLVAIPEPSTLALLGAGLAGVAAIARKRRAGAR